MPGCAAIGSAVLVGGTVAAVVAVGATVAVGASVALGLALGLALGVTDGDGLAAAEHAAFEMTLLSSVTAPFRASALPCSVAPVSSVMDVRARMVPWKLVVLASVAELPTCQ